MEKVNARDHAFRRILLYKKAALYTPEDVNKFSIPEGVYKYYTYGKKGQETTPCVISDGPSHREYFTGVVLSAKPVKFPEGKSEKYLGEHSFILKGMGADGTATDASAATLKDYLHDYAPKIKYREQTVVMRPVSGDTQRRLLFSGDEEWDQNTGCILHMRADFDTNGDGFFNSWFEHIPSFQGEDFPVEVDAIVDELRDLGPLRSRNAMYYWNGTHPDARISQTENVCGFTFDTENYSYYLRCKPMRGDYDAYLYCYNKQRLQEFLPQDQADPEPQETEPEVEPEPPELAMTL